jgi:hypothetical protein
MSVDFGSGKSQKENGGAQVLEIAQPPVVPQTGAGPPANIRAIK